MKHLIFTICLLVSSVHYSQEYVSDFEEEVFSNYENDPLDFDFIASLIAIDSTKSLANVEAYKLELDRFAQGLAPKEIKAKREKKRIQRIYSEIHDRFFTKYQDIAYFSEIFENGTYNCVTATALYAYIFDVINVPYAIKDAPGHVFMIAYPESHKIVLETTAPGTYGLVAPKDSDVRDQVKQLVDLKLVTSAEVSQKGESKTFIDFFYGEERLNKAALIGMQYYNYGLQFFEEQKFKEALNVIDKSLVFFPYKPAEFLKIGLIGLTLEETEFNTQENIDYLVDVLNTETYSKDITSKDAGYLMYQITKHDDNDLSFIKKAAAKMDLVKNTDLRNAAREELYEYIARKSADRVELKDAIIASDSVLVTNPKSKIAKEIITYAVGNLMRKAPAGENTLSELLIYYNSYPFLQGDINIESLRAIQLGMIIQNNFKNKKPEVAKEYLNTFEGILDTYESKLQINPEATAQLYLLAGRYYYGKTRNKEALAFFEKGLKYNPEHLELKKMAKWAKEDMK